MIDLFQDNVPIDADSDRTSTQKARLETSGGAAYLAELAEMVPTQRMSCTTPRWCGKGCTAALIQTATTIVTESCYDAEDVDTLLDQVSRRSLNGQRKTTAGFVHNAILKGVSGALSNSTNAELVTVSPQALRISTAKPPAQPSDLIIIAARRCGKTALGLNIAEHVGVRPSACGDF
jgi:replicative DNA helicase